MRTAVQLHPVVAQWMVQALTRLLGTFGFLQGLFIIIGGADRWRSPGLRVAMMVPGAPASWGIAIGVFGILTVVGTFKAWMRVTELAMFGIACWCLFFAISIVITVVTDGRVSTTGVFTYLFVAIMACTLGAAYGQSHHYKRGLRGL